jgi:hypothetical protein
MKTIMAWDGADRYLAPAPMQGNLSEALRAARQTNPILPGGPVLINYVAPYISNSQ